MTIEIVPSVFDASLFIGEFRNRKKEAVLGEMVSRAHRAGAVTRPALVRDILLLRERAGSTAVGNGAAVPNARSIAVVEPRVVLGRSRRGVPWDGERVHLVLMALSPADVSLDAHFELIGGAVALVRTRRNRQRLLEADSFEAISGLLQDQPS